jgi:hypothetical protein
MGDLWWSFILAAGAGLFVYLKFGRNVGYSNGQTVWIMTLATFTVAFLFIFSLTRYVLHAQL